MAEEKQKKKKLVIIRHILKCIGLAVLSLLLILAIVFQAPWKVITLLAIILAACTILPRQFRKWFWLLSASIVIVLIIWVFLPDDEENWRPYTFDEELSALEAKYAIPDEENAALIYDELPDTISGDPNKPEFFLRSTPSSRDEPWLSKDHPETAEWLKGYQSTIEKLLQAAKKNKCYFPISADTLGYSQNVERLPKMRYFTFLLLSAANNDIGEGRINEGLEKYLGILQMAKHQYQQPTLLDFLVGVAIERLAIRQFKRFVVTGDATEEHLNVIEKAVAEIKHDLASDLPRFLEYKKLMVKIMIGMFYEINPKGKVRLTRDPTEAMKAQLPQSAQDIPPLTYWQKKLLKGSAILGWFFMPSTPQKAGRILDECYEKYYAMTEPNFAWQEKYPVPFSMLKFCCQFKLNYRYFANCTADMTIEPLYGISDLYLRAIAEQRGARIIIALRHYKNNIGHWPGSLGDIKSLAPAEIFVDPINGGSFIYKLTEDNFTLYSKGKNGIDEGGEYESKWDPNTYEHTVEKDDRLIWPRRSRKAKEEKADVEQQ